MKKKLIIIGIIVLIVVITVVVGFVIWGNKDTSYLDDYIVSNEEHEYIVESDYYTQEGYFKDIVAKDYVQNLNVDSIIISEDLNNVDVATIDAEIESILAEYITTEEITDTQYQIKDGDTVNIDYVGSVDGVEFEGGSTMGQGTEVIIGETQYIDGFLEQLVGRKTNENFDINVTFPESYASSPDLQGKAAVFNITINAIYEEIQPELTNEFLSTNYPNKYNTVEEFRADIEKEIIDYNKLDYIVGELLNNSTISEYPEKLTEYTNRIYIDQVHSEASQYGFTAQEYLQQFGFESEEQYIELQKEVIEETMKFTLIYQAIAEMNNMSVSVEDINQFFIENFNTSDWSQYSAAYGENYIKNIVLQEKVNEYLLTK